MRDTHSEPTARRPRAPSPALMSLPVARLFPDPEGQVRRRFDAAAIQTLAESLRRSGVRAPVIVVPLVDRPGDYRIVAGERRWRAAHLAGLNEIPCLVDARLADPAQCLLAQAEENVHRVDLNAVEEAAALVRIMDAFHVDSEAAGAMLGRSYQQARRLVQIHEAPQPVKEAIVSGLVDTRAALELVRIYNKLARRGGPGRQERSLRELEELIDRVVNERWTIRRLERYAKDLEGEGPPAAPAASPGKATGTVPPPLPASPGGAPWKQVAGGVLIDTGRIARNDLTPEHCEGLVDLLEDLLMKVRRPRTASARWESPRG
jgi:ParB family chromosome partitioning protein